MPLIPHPAYPVEPVVCLSNYVAPRPLGMFDVVEGELIKSPSKFAGSETI